ncbi:MAG: hypothetical protein IH931_04820, partial [candidate division Zixibacteria bacterium]|nr:hypothetical protein [candidate division Zixibacteria bacterium]
MNSFYKSAIVLILLYSLFSMPALADEKGSEFYNFIQSQFKNPPTSYLGSSSSFSDSNFVIEIWTVYDVEPGSIIDVAVTLNNAPYEMWGFDFLFSYDHAALSFNDVIPGIDMFDADSGCGWEYFEWRQGSSGNCGSSSCPTGIIRVVAIPDLGVPHTHPSCLNPETPASMFSLRFLVTNDFTYNCSLIPVRFIWYDCFENLISFNDPEGPQFNQKLAASNGVYYNGHLIPPSHTFPSFGGTANTCFRDTSSHNALFPLIDFHNGGVYIKCDESQYSVGDIDLDGFPYGVHDIALFGSYFLEGESVFDIDPSRQIAATDINSDGQSLKLEDLVQLGRIRLHEIHPDSTNDIVIYGDNYIANDRDIKRVSLIVENPIPVLWLKFFGEITPVNDNHDYIIISKYNGLYTRVIVAAYDTVDSGSVFLFDYEGKGDLVGTQASNLLGHEISTYYFNCGFGRNCRLTLEIG